MIEAPALAKLKSSVEEVASTHGPLPTGLARAKLEECMAEIHAEVEAGTQKSDELALDTDNAPRLAKTEPLPSSATMPGSPQKGAPSPGGRSAGSHKPGSPGSGRPPRPENSSKDVPAMPTLTRKESLDSEKSNWQQRDEETDRRSWVANGEKEGEGLEKSLQRGSSGGSPRSQGLARTQGSASSELQYDDDWDEDSWSQASPARSMNATGKQRTGNMNA